MRFGMMVAALATVMLGCGGKRTAPSGTEAPNVVAAASPSDAKASAEPTYSLSAAAADLADGERAAKLVIGDETGMTVPIGADNVAKFTLRAEPGMTISSGGVDGIGTLAVEVPVPGLELADFKNLSEGPIANKHVVAVTLSHDGKTRSVDVTLVVSPSTAAFAKLRQKKLVLRGESKATATGVIDLVDPGHAYYQGPEGPFSNARYVAIASDAGAGPDVPCDGSSVGTRRLDVTVVDRFVGKVAGKQQFKPEPYCNGIGGGTLTVSPQKVREWLRAQFVRDGGT